MSINGGVKFFEKNYALSRDGATGAASSNDDSIGFILDLNRFTQWESIGSNDLTTETITITLSESKVIDRIMLLDMNFKEFTIKYDNGSTFVDFTNAIGVNSEVKGAISETAYTRDTAYYEFDSVTTDSIQITCLKTQVVDAQKSLTGLIVTEEIGTLQGFPRVQPQSSRNERKIKALSQKLIVQKTYETNRVRITFKTHPFQNDLDIIETLFDREESFLVYPCGGRTGTTFFKMDQMNWRLKDIYNMQLIGKLKNQWEKGVYLLGFNKTITLEEHI